jgi:hypothetical protein
MWGAEAATQEEDTDSQATCQSNQMQIEWVHFMHVQTKYVAWCNRGGPCP